jgi:hypothetical protein
MRGTHVQSFNVNVLLECTLSADLQGSKDNLFIGILFNLYSIRFSRYSANKKVITVWITNRIEVPLEPMIKGNKYNTRLATHLATLPFYYIIHCTFVLFH